METQTRFDLTQAIAEWRSELALRETIGADQLRELEAHLLDCFAVFRTKGLTDDEAFALAKHKIGPVGLVADEFKKGDPNGVIRTRVFWMLMGVAGILFVAEVLRAVLTAISMSLALFWTLPMPSDILIVDPDLNLEQTVLLNIPLTTQFYFAIAFSAVFYIGAYHFSRRNNLWQQRCKRAFNSRWRFGFTIAVGLIGMSITSRWLQAFTEEFLATGGDFRWVVPKSVTFFVFLINPILLTILATISAPRHLLTEQPNR